MQHRMHSGQWAAVGVLLTMVLSGCASAPSGVTEPTAPAATTPAPETTTFPSRLLPDIAPGTVLATGTIQPHKEATNGTVTGELSIVAAENSTFVLRLDAVSAPEYTELAPLLVDVPYDEVTCWEGFWAFSGGNIPLVPGSTRHLSDSEPSAYREALLTGTRPGEEMVLGCTYPVIAIAELVWTMPNPFAELAPADSGVRPGAAGTVTLTDAGALSRYSVVPGDSRDAIRDRFGLDLEEFWYLNHRNRPFLEAGMTLADLAAGDADSPLSAGDELNLDPGDRSR